MEGLELEGEGALRRRRGWGLGFKRDGAAAASSSSSAAAAGGVAFGAWGLGLKGKERGDGRKGSRW